jgi:alkylated DNA repair dioxygenase AlkB
MKIGELPSWVMSLAEKLKDYSFMQNTPDQLIINEYLAGQGITNHVDCEPCFGDTIISLSLGSTCVMDFINKYTKEKIEVLLEPRSLVILKDEARYDWTHGIQGKKSDFFKNQKHERNTRISLTFRSVIVNTCDTQK